MLCRRLSFLLALPLLCAVPTAGRRSEAYFSLSTTDTFLPSDKVSIRLSSSGVNALEFRVYKVKDPAAFFERLGDAHNFGRITPKENVVAPTPIERFHDWKHRIWVSIRNFFREQFSGESREKIREAQKRKANPDNANGGKPGSKPPAADIFAQVPLLNSSQLVLRWRQDVPSHFYYERETVPINSLGKGVYLVEATNGELRAYTIVIVSELGIITKMAPGQILAFAADRRTGAPVSGADIRVWSDAKEQSKQRTDANGLAETSLAQGQYQDVRIVAVHGDDVAVLTPYSWNLSSNPAEDITGYIYTDRPIYRPGHVVHFKVILRAHGGDTYELPANKPVQIEIQDPSGKSVLQTKLTLSQFGTVHGDFTVATNAALGYYSIFVTAGDANARSANGGFHVEEYKKPEYEVKVTPSQPRVLQGDEITATIAAKYYFGEPVAGANVKYVVHTSAYWSPFIERDDEDGGRGDEEGAENSDESQGDYYYDYDRRETSEQSGKLDADGRLTVHIPTKPDDRHRDLRYRIEARVTDDANREISGVNFVVATYGAFALGVSTESYIYKAGDKVVAIVNARDYDGHPVRTPVRVDLVRQQWSYSRMDETVVASQDAQTGDDGAARLTFAPTEAGSFLVKVSAMTIENREITETAWLWITGSDFNMGWWGESRRQIRLIADKKSYKVGDTAHVMIVTGVPDAHILVTTEGRNIHSKKVVHAKSQTITVDIPLRSNDQPNIFVAAAFLNDNKLYESTRNLKVPAIQTKLHIEIQRTKDQFQPGQKAGYTIIARDANDKPVSGEFSIGIVDEAIYAIAPEASGDIHDFFYATVYDRVSTEASLSYYFNGEAGKKQIYLAWQSKSRTALAQLKPSDALVEPKVRKDFPDTALWLADVRTDANGHAHADLNLPDLLTTWRATVRGVTADTKVGSAIDRVIVRKNLMVRLAVPRFFRQGDQVVVSTIVHNYLATAKTVRVSLALKGLDILDGQTREIEVPSRGEAKLDWRVRAQSVSEADLLAKALTNEESDALELTLPVIPFGVKLSDAKSGSILAADGSDDVTITLPGNPDQSAPTLDVTLSSSVAGSLFNALDYLTSYPYGCTEQTMSSFLPDIVVAKAMKDLHLQSTVDTPELEKKIAAGMERLKGFQHDDGGWGWWKDDDSRVFMTAYVVSGFGQAHAAGYDVNSDVLAKAEQYLLASLDRSPNMEPNLQAYVIYALALNNAGRREFTQATWEKRDAMNTQGLAMLGLALQIGGDTARAKEIAGTIASQVTESELEAYWPSGYDYFMGFEFNDNAETTAYAVQLLSRVKPESALLPKAAFWLVNHRDGGYFWVSTKETAMVIFGLTDYVKASHELDANFKADLSINGKPALAHQFTSADSFSVTQPGIHLAAAQLLPGTNTIHIHKSGTGRLYWSASGHYYSNEKRVIQQNKLSLNITRDYYRLSPEQLKDRIVYRLNTLAGELHVGDVVAVRVTVSGGDWHYLLIEDPIPAGAESISRDDLYEFANKPAWWERWYVSRELHDDRAAFFQTDFYGRHHEYVYLLKIVNPGKFNVSPAMVQPMYQPSIQATTDAATIEVK
jgi:alpha-2-macroglobulin